MTLKSLATVGAIPRARVITYNNALLLFWVKNEDACFMKVKNRRQGWFAKKDNSVQRRARGSKGCLIGKVKS